MPASKQQAIQNLKGMTGAKANPNGRPKKGYSITEWFQEMLKANPETRDAIGASITAKALEGDPAAIKLVWNYMDGMPKQSVQLSGDEDNPVKVEVSSMLDKVYGINKSTST